jgi:hypothetical protein
MVIEEAEAGKKQMRYAPDGNSSTVSLHKLETECRWRL